MTPDQMSEALASQQRQIAALKDRLDGFAEALAAATASVGVGRQYHEALARQHRPHLSLVLPEGDSA